MIVQCASCQTKFRVPDDKIGEKPVKVRCSKCQSVFSVKRGADGNAVASALPGAKAPPPPAPPPPAAPPPAAPPSAESAAPSDPFAAFGPPPARPSEATTPGVWHAGIAESRREQNEVTRRAPMPDPEPTRPGFALNALMASKLDAAAPPPAVESAPDPFAGLPPAAPEDLFGAPAADTFGAPPPSSPTDPFAAAPPPAAPLSAMDPFAAPPEAVAPPEPPPAAPEPAASEAMDPFANLDLAAAPLPPPPEPAPAKSDPFANLDLGAVAGKVEPSPAPAPAPQAPGVSFSFESPPGADAAASGSADDFFSSAEPASQPQSSVGPEAFGADETTQTQPAGEPDRSLFDLPEKPPPAPLPAPETPFDNVPTRVAPIPEPVPRPATAGPSKPSAPKKPFGQRLMGGLVSALFIVAVGWASLLTYATARADWRFDPGLLRPAELGRAVFGKQGAAAQLALEDVSSGTYALHDGRTAFYVRGELVNRGKAPVGPARARVEVLDADRVLASAEAWAGQPVTPEQVYELGDAQQLEALRQQEQGKARPLAPGESRPFVAVMLDVPGSSAIRSVRIVPELGAAK